VTGANGSTPGGFGPVRLLELELGDLRLRSFGPPRGAARCRSARVLVRLHGAPLGVLDIDRHDAQLRPEALAERARRELGEAI
jgi:hypothetical protein